MGNEEGSKEEEERVAGGGVYLGLVYDFDDILRRQALLVQRELQRPGHLVQGIRFRVEG